MKNKLIRNVNLEKSETLLREFRNMPSKSRLCSMLVTNHRLIVYTYGRELVKGRYVRRQAMNEIELKFAFIGTNIFTNPSISKSLFRFFGLLLFLGGAFLAVANYMGALTVTIPGFVVEWYYPYVAGLLIVLLRACI
ncbi:MAG: hypothetical protein MZU97_22210 [Bacillus subtilis]|nr:hypothetical protein [Bacillus subtilis]